MVVRDIRPEKGMTQRFVGDAEIDLLLVDLSQQRQVCGSPDRNTISCYLLLIYNVIRYTSAILCPLIFIYITHLGLLFSDYLDYAAEIF